MLFLLIFLSVSGTIFQSFDLTLDPADLLWPNSWVSSPVTFSSSHAGTSGVTATINCQSPVDIPSGSYYSVTIKGFPSVLTGLTLIDMPANTPNVFQIPSITLSPTPGSFGPISILFRQVGSAGQILASASSFGFVGVAPVAPTAIAGLSVCYTSSASSLVQASTSIQFSFSLTANLHQYDFFVLSVPRLYSFPSLSQLVWTASETGYGYFNTTGYDYSATAQTFTVYGVQQAFTADVTVDFSVSGFNNPEYVTTGATATWTLQVFRFGTSTILQQVTGTGPLATTTAGTVNFGSWGPSNGYLTASQIIAGISTYMTLTFSCQHPVPPFGTITITFSTGVSLTTGYINSAATQLRTNLGTTYGLLQPSNLFTSTSPVLTAQVATITVGSTALPAGITVTLYTICTFSSTSASISSILTQDGVKTIDSSSSLYQLTYPLSTSVAATVTEPNIYFTSSLTLSGRSINTCGPVSTGGLNVDFQIDSSLSSGQTVTVNLPVLNQGSSADASVGLGPVVWGKYPAIASSSATSYATATTLNVSPVVSAGSIVITLGTTYSSNNYVSVLVGTGTNPGTLSAIYMPNFPTSVYSRHEVTLQYTAAGTSVLRVYSKPLYFQSATAAPQLEPFCKDTGIPGMPAQMKITPPFAYTPATGYTTYIDFSITSTDTSVTAGLSTGLSSGSTYPSSGLAAGATLTLVYSSLDTTNYVSHLNLTQTAWTNSLITFYFPFPALTASYPPSVKASIVALYSDGTRYYITNAVAATNTFPSPAAGAGTDFSGGTPLATTTQTAAGTLTLTTASNNYLATSNVGFTFDMGFSVSSPALTVGTSLTLTTYSSNSAVFPYLTVHAFAATVASSVTSWTLAGVTTSWMSGTKHMYGYALLASANMWLNTGVACDVSGYYPFTLTPTALAYVSGSYSPATAIGQGANSFATNFTVAFTAPGPIHGLPNSQISITLGSYFLAIPGTSWSVTAEGYSQTGTSFISNGFAANQITTDIPSGSTITIKVTGAQVPTSTASAAYYGFTSVYVQYGATNIYAWVAATNDAAVGLIKTQTTVSVGTPAGSSNISLVSLFPNTLGATGAYLQLQFSPVYALPAGSVVTISGNSFLADASATSNTWCNYGFTSVSVTSSNLVFTLNSAVPAGALVELRKDRALSISAAATSPGPAFLITAYYGSTSIIYDSPTSVTAASKPIYTARPTASVTSATLTLNQTNFGVFSVHNFTFKLSVNSRSTYYYCFDADGNYDAHFGDWVNFHEAPGIYYVWAYSHAISSYVMCTVDHWVVICGSVGVIKAGSAIDFSFNAWNSNVQSVTWNLYIVVMNGNAMVSVVAPYYLITAGLTAIPAANVDLYFVTHKSTPAETYDLTFQALISEIYSAGASIFIEFPPEFELGVDNGSNMDCSGIYQSTPPVTLISTGSKCTVWGNTVVMPISAATALTTNYWTSFTVNNILSARNGRIRTTGYDVTKPTQFTVYDLWTSSFRIYTTTSSTATLYSSMSLANLGAAYTGFMNPNWFSFSINNGNTIYLTAGTFSAPIMISAGAALKAANVKLIPTDAYEGVLAFDCSSYSLFFFSPSDYFRVGVPTGTPEGFYYISWTIVETPLETGILLYGAPRKTVVQVYSTGQVPINIGSISSVPLGGVGLPILLDIEGGLSPYSDITVTFSCGSTAGVTFIPPASKFTSMMTTGAFEISYNGTSVAGTSISIAYQISGTDNSTFSIATGGSFILGNFTSEAPSISSLLITVQSQNEATVSIDLATASLVTWAFGATSLFENSPKMASYETIAFYAYPVIGTPTANQTTVEDQIYLYSEVMDAVDPQKLGWNAYSVQLLKLAQLTYFTGQAYLPAGNSTVYLFNSLIASVYYTVYAYADNYSGNTPALAHVTQVTRTFANPCLLTCALSDAISPSETSLINTAIAETLYLLPQRVVNFNQTSRRRLSNSITSLILGDVRSSITPLSLGSSIISQSSTLLASIVKEGVTATAVSISAREINETDYTAPYFMDAVITGDVNGMQFNFTSATDGIVCCEGEYNPNFTVNVTSYDVFLQVDRNGNIPTLHWCWNVTAGMNYSEYYNFTANGNINYGTYTFTCTDCNEYPIWPVCLNDTDLISYSLTWTNIISGADYLIVVLSGILTYLL